MPMTVDTYVEIFEDVQDRKDKRLVDLGRKHFLQENNIVPQPDQLIHAVSYSLKEKDLIIEVYLDQVCSAVAFHFPTTQEKFRKIVIQVLTEELIAQVCLQELKMFFEGERWVGELLAGSIVDEVVDGIMGRSYSKIMRDRAAHRLLRRYTR